MAGVGATTPALQQATHVVPIVFAQGIDPVGAGYIDSLGRPGGNTTGFVQLDYGLAGKWLELLKEVAPQIKHVTVEPENVQVKMNRGATVSTLAIDIEIPA